MVKKTAGDQLAGDSTFMPSHAIRTAATAALGAAIVGPAVTHVIFSDFERYRAPEATTATFVAGEGHESLCWLPRGRGAAPSKNHCYEFPPVEGGSRRREIQTYSGHCFGFLNGSDVVTGSACVARGRTEHGPDSSSVLDRLLELRASAAAALARQRRRIYRALQLLLLADVAFFGTGSTGRRRKGPPALVWTTHHLFLSVGVGTMLLDHAAKGLLNHGGSLLTMPAQVGGGAPSPFPHHSLTHHPPPSAAAANPPSLALSLLVLLPGWRKHAPRRPGRRRRADRRARGTARADASARREIHPCTHSFGCT